MNIIPGVGLEQGQDQDKHPTQLELCGECRKTVAEVSRTELDSSAFADLVCSW